MAQVDTNQIAPIDSEMASAYRSTLQKIEQIAQKYSMKKIPRLVAVSKTKPIEKVRSIYDLGQRHFGENYVQELIEKAQILPGDIQWHFIGHLQSNKVKSLMGIPNLYVVESVDSTKLANKLDKAVAATGRPPLNVFVQVNTSDEDQKSGIAPENAVELCAHILHECPHLNLSGLMTIGAYGVSAEKFFVKLSECRRHMAESLGLDETNYELSMGMSADFELAIQHGSTNVRVGSTIFGAREMKSSSN